MKLRNFMYATMIACAFASCSKDEVIDNGPDQPAKGDASLTISLNTAGTKSVVATGGEAETTIHDLTIFLVDDENNVVGKQYVNDASDLSVTFDKLTVGQTLHCVGFANFGKEITEDEAKGDITLTTVENKNIGGEKLPMHGVSSEVPIEVGVNTARLILIRDLARVELVALNLDMSSGRQNKYTGGEFSLKFLQASLNSAAKSVSFASNLTATRPSTYKEASLFIGGLGTGWLWKKDQTDVKNTVSETAFETYLTSGTGEESVATYEIGVTSKEATAGQPSVVYYVLPNAKAGQPTVLTLKGQFSITNGSTSSQSNINKTIDSYYNIEIGNTGTVSGDNYTKGSGIIANKNYKITAIVAGEGNDIGGDKPSLIVTTEVSNWDDVTQVAPVL